MRIVAGQFRFMHQCRRKPAGQRLGVSVQVLNVREVGPPACRSRVAKEWRI